MLKIRKRYETYNVFHLMIFFFLSWFFHEYLFIEKVFYNVIKNCFSRNSGNSVCVHMCVYKIEK